MTLLGVTGVPGEDRALQAVKLWVDGSSPTMPPGVVRWSVGLADNPTEIPAIVLRQTIIRDLFEEFGDIQRPNDNPEANARDG
jgi:hypothetical protein